MLERVAGITWKRPRTVLAMAAVLAIVAAAFGRDVEHHLKAAGFSDSASESERATGMLREGLGYDPAPAMVFVVRAPGGGPLDVSRRDVRREVDRLARAIDGVPGVGRVSNPLRDTDARSLLAADGASLVLAAHLTTRDVEDVGGVVAEEARERVRSASLHVAMGGYAPSFNDVNDQTREDLTTSELIAFPALAVLLLLVFRGVVAALLPLMIGALSILGTFLVLRISAGLVDTSLFALNIATALSLGLAVDYALLIVSRYREEVARHGATWEAHRTTVATAGRTAFFSGCTVAVAMAALGVMPQRFLYSLGIAGAAVGVLSALIAIVVLPAMLAVLGTRVNKWSVRRGPGVSGRSDRWHRVAEGVMRRPAAVGAATAALLLAAAAPLSWSTLTGPSAEVVPPGLPTYEPNHYVEQHYPRDVTEAVTVAVRNPGNAADLERFRGRLAHIEGVERVAPFAAAGELAFTNLALDAPALSGRSQGALRAIRDLPPPGSESLVAGNTARFLDQQESLLAHAPVVVAVVAAGTLLLLFALTGSVLLPLITLAMNVLTLAATVGLLVLGFQEGLLRGLLDDTGPQAIEMISLVFLFTVTFALATDYAVLVLARIKEHHDAGKPTAEAVAAGIGATGRIISAAALMIAVVFLAFAVSPVFFMKQIAIGMALGVLIDATVVRALLVPALMRLLGERGWWAPASFTRLRRRYRLGEEPAAS